MTDPCVVIETISHSRQWRLVTSVLVVNYCRSIQSVYRVAGFIKLKLSKVYRPTKRIKGHIGDEFLGVKWPNQQCQRTEGR